MSYRDQMSAHEAAEWVVIRARMYFTYALGATTILTIITSILLSVFVTTPAVMGVIVGIILALPVCWMYSEYAETYHFMRIRDKRAKEAQKKEEGKAQELSLREAERIVAKFGKGV